MIKNNLSKPNNNDSFVYSTNDNAWHLGTASGTGGSGGVAVAVSGHTQSTGTVVFSNSNGVTFGLNAGTITASVAQQSINISAGTQNNPGSNFIFSNSNNVSFGLNANTITASVPTQTSLSFSNANGFSFGIAGSTVTGSYTVPPTAGLISRINLSAGTTSNNLTALTLSNSNGLSFGLNGSVVTGSYTVPSTAGLISAINVSAGSTSNNLTALTFSDSNGLSFGFNGSTITGSYSQSNQTLRYLAFGNTTNNTSQTVDARSMSFIGLGGNTVGYSNGSLQFSGVTTAGLISRINISAGTASANISALTFSNSNGISFGLSNSVITGSYTVPSTAGLISGINVSAGTTSNNLSAITFSNSNGLVFGLDQSTITADFSQRYIILGNTTGQSSSSNIQGSNQQVFAFGAISAGMSVGGLALSVPVQSVQTQSNIQQLSAGTEVASTGMVTFANSNNMSFGLNANVMTASFFTSQSAATLSRSGNADGNGLSGQYGNGTAVFWPFDSPAYCSFSRFDMFLSNALNTSSNSSFAFALSAGVGIYRINGTSLSLLSSGSQSTAITNSSSNSVLFLTGVKNFTIPINVNMSPGNYVVGLLTRTATTNANWITINNMVFSAGANQFSGMLGSTVRVSDQMVVGLGAYSVSSTTLNTSYALSGIGGNALTNVFYPVFDFRNY